MKRTLTVTAADRTKGVTFEQIAALVHEVEMTRTQSNPVRLTVRVGFRKQLLTVDAEYVVFPSDAARIRQETDQ